MAVGKVSWVLLSGASIVLLVALWLNWSDESQAQRRLQLILGGLLKTETEVSGKEDGSICANNILNLIR